MLAPVLNWETQLPDGIIKKYVEINTHISETYPEFNYLCILNVLAVLAGRKFGYYTPWELLTPQSTAIYSYMLGASSSKKSTAIKNASAFLDVVAKSDQFEPCRKIPKNFSRESFEIELLGDNSQLFEANSCGYLWYDEVVSLISSMNARGGYNAGLRDKFCAYWDGEPIEIIRKNPDDRTKNISIKSDLQTRLNLLFSTTLTNFTENSFAIDATSGYLLRFLFVAPQYEQKTIGERDEIKNRADLLELAAKVTRIYAKWQNAYAKNKDTMYLTFSDAQKQKLDGWYHEVTTTDTDSLNVSYIGKIQNYVLKLSVLFHVSDETWTETDLEVSDYAFDMAFNLCKDFHFVTYRAVSELISSNPSAMQTRILRKLESMPNKTVTHRDLTRAIQPKNRKEFDENIRMLQVDMQLIDVFVDKDGTTQYQLHNDDAFTMDINCFNAKTANTAPKTIEITF